MVDCTSAVTVSCHLMTPMKLFVA